jgi:Gpi18-like mannosyltransferase
MTGRRTVWLIAAYPFALFFGAIYTESLYLLGATAAFYHLRRRELWRAGAWGLLVGLTRPNGAFLSVPLALIGGGAVDTRVAERRPGGKHRA